MTAGKKIHMDDESLRQALARCRLGDEQALAALIAWQMPRIRAAAQAGVCPGLDFEDAVQEGIIALFSAINTYSEEKALRFLLMHLPVSETEFLPRAVMPEEKSTLC